MQLEAFLCPEYQAQLEMFHDPESMHRPMHLPGWQCPKGLCRPKCVQAAGETVQRQNPLDRLNCLLQETQVWMLLRRQS